MSVENRLRYASDGSGRESFTCGVGGQTVICAVEGVFANRRVGSLARLCTPACRGAAYRRRRAGMVENTPLHHPGRRRRSLTGTDPAAAPPDPASETPTPQTARSATNQSAGRTPP